MAPLDWNHVMNIPLDALADDTGDDLYFQLIDFNPDNENNIERLQRLFLVTRGLMQIKGMQADVAMEEMVQMAETQSATNTEKEKELQKTIDDLKHQLNSKEQLISKDNMEQIKDEIRELEKENEFLHKQLQELQQNVTKLEDTVKKERNKVKQLEKENNELKIDIQHSKDEISQGCQRIEELQEVTENKSAKKQEELSQRLHEKNQQIHKLFDEIKEYEIENESLQQQTVEMREKFEEAMTQMGQTANDFIKIKETLQQTETAADAIRRERDYYKEELENLNQQKNINDNDNDQILKTVSSRVQEWKEILMKKEEEIAHYQELVKQLQSHIVSVRVDGEHTTVAILSKALEEKDKQIHSLRQQLSRATKDIEENTKIIEHMKEQLDNGITSFKLDQTNDVLELQNTLHETGTALELTQEMLGEMEEETKKKDKILNETLSRMRQYEMGQYGLADAVAEIKECKNMIRVRDKQIEELVQQLNGAEIEINDLSEENEILRKKLGMDPQRPIKALSQNYTSQKQKECSLILSLQQKIENLEEERVQLRQKVHEQEKEIQQKPEPQSSFSSPSVKKSDKQYSPTKEHKENRSLILKLQDDNNKLKEAIEKLTDENKHLQTGLKEMIESLKGIDEKNKLSYDIEDLEELIRNALEKSALSITHKIDIPEIQRKNIKSNDVENKQINVIYPNPTSDLKNDSAILNNHILEILKEFKSLEKIVTESEEKTEKCHNQFLLNRHQLGLIYQQYLEEKSQFKSQEKKWENEKRDLEEKSAVDAIKLEEFQHLLDTLAQDEPEVRRRLSETIRQMTALRVNEEILHRKCSILENIEMELQKENNKLKHECMSTENSIITRFGKLQRFKEMATYKIKALLKALEESVPLDEMEAINKQYMDLAIKYNSLLDKEVSVSNMAKEQLQMTNNWENENKTLLKMLENEKKRIHYLEGILEKHIDENIIKNESVDEEIIALSEKLSAFEVKELNERQRADHLQQLYDQQKQVIKSLEERNNELDEKVTKLMQQNINKHGSFEKIAENTFMENGKKDQQKVKELEEAKIKLEIEVMKLKEISEVACHQLKSIQKQSMTQDQELKIIHKQFIELQSSNDDKMTLGKLYRQILQFQLNEANLTHKLELANSKIIKLEAECLNLTKRCENKEEAIYTLHNKFLNKCQFLMKVIKELRREYSGSISLSKLEKMYQSITHLREEKLLLSKELQEANDKTEVAELKQNELEIKVKGLEEILSSVKTNTNEKIFQWHMQFETLRLNEIKAKREIEKKTQELLHQGNLVKYLEKQINELEEENMTLEKKLNDKWLHWEETEIELEIQKKDLQKTLGNTVHFAELDKLLSGKPDHSQTESVQLEQALNIIKKKQLSLEDQQEKIKMLEEKVTKLEINLHDAENALLARDQVITKLRSNISVSNTDIAQIGPTISLDHSETKQTIKAAQSTVKCLQARLTQKEASISRYKELLKKTQDENEVQKSFHQKELLSLWEKLQVQQNHAVSTVRQVASKMINKPANTENNKNIVRLQELEEIVVDKEREIILLSQQLKVSQNEIDKWKKEVEIVRRQRDIDQQSIEKELRNNIQTLQHELNEKKQELVKYKENIHTLKNELNAQKVSFKQMTTQKSANVCDQLKQELAGKEKQLQALSKALTDLRSEMMITVEDNLASYKQEPIDHATMKKFIENHTKELQDKTKLLESQNSKLKRDYKQQIEKISTMEKEIQGLRDDVAQKTDTAIKTRKENEILQKKINRLKINLQEKKIIHPESEELLKLQKKIQMLEEQLNRQQQPEKPYDQVDKLTKSQEEILRWEEGKRWQQIVERLKQRYQNKDEEFDSLKKTEKLLRDQVNRCDREKLILENRIKNLCQKLTTENNDTIIKSSIYQDMLNKNNALEKEKTNVEEKLTVEMNKVKALQQKIQILENEIDELKQEINSLTTLSKNQAQSENDTSKFWNQDEEQILKLKEENLELKLELKQMQIDVPHLNNKIADLQKYCDTLKQELAKQQNITDLQENDQEVVEKNREKEHNFVSDKIHEEKIKILEDLLAEKSEALTDVKTLLKESIEKEEKLLYEKQISDIRSQETNPDETHEETIYNNLLTENTELKLNMRILEKEFQRNQNEIKELKQACCNIEEMKSTLQQKEEECTKYKERLIHLSDQLGIEDI